jgi:hypothetical protein
LRAGVSSTHGAQLARFHLLCFALLAAITGRAVQAQVDTGRVETLRLIGVLDAKTGDWINRAIVRDTLGTETQTTRYGVATLNVLTPIAGYYIIEIRKDGYIPRRIRLRADTSYQLMFALEPNPLGNATQLPTVVVTDQQRLQRDLGERGGFFTRCQTKTVQCVGVAELDRRPTGYLDNMLSMKMGVHRACIANDHGPVLNPAPQPVFEGELLGCLIQMRSAQPPPPYCTPSYFVDGFEWVPLAGRAQGQIDQFLPPKRIAGIEVYLANDPRPARFSTSLFAACGAIVIWTR